MPTPIEIKCDRFDLTDYLIHFTRSNNGLPAFGVLKQIVTDGYLKGGWSPRSARKTVFGTEPAVCFTETPLNGFLDYVKKRKNLFAIDNYGIFVKKKDLFLSGGRSVIYGTTLDPKESQQGEYWFIDGLSQEEQYRYILTKINEKNDWMHEREWRWANWNRKSTLDGLPLWKIGQNEPFPNSSFRFSPIGIIVKTMQQKQLLEDILIGHYMAEKSRSRIDSNDIFDRDFSKQSIESTVIVVLDGIDKTLLEKARIEEIMALQKYYSLFCAFR
jgi:hypothetical protein